MNGYRIAIYVLPLAVFLSHLFSSTPALGGPLPGVNAGDTKSLDEVGRTHGMDFAPVRGGTLVRTTTDRGYLGLNLQQSSKPGVLVMDVKEDGPCFGSGILSGDMIIGLGGTQIRDQTQLSQFMEEETLPGMVLEVVVLRQGVEQSFRVTLVPVPTPSYLKGRGAPAERTPATEVADFYLGAHEVTQAQWEAVMGSSPSHFRGPNRPVESVPLKQVHAFIQKLNAMSGMKYRLPTEDEWEYAARSGGQAERWSGVRAESLLGDYAWFGRNSGGDTHDVARKRPNGLGLFDMTGNVEEYCSDPFALKRGVRNTETAPIDEDCHIVRGGSWSHAAWASRNDSRRCLSDQVTDSTVGFRLAVDNKPDEEQMRLPAVLRFRLESVP